MVKGQAWALPGQTQCKATRPMQGLAAGGERAPGTQPGLAGGSGAKCLQGQAVEGWEAYFQSHIPFPTPWQSFLQTNGLWNGQ